MPEADGLEEAGRGALERRFDLAAQVGLTHVAGRVKYLPLVPDLQEQVKIVGIG